MGVASAEFSYVASKTVKCTIRREDGALRAASGGAFNVDSAANWSGALHTMAAIQTGSKWYVLNLATLSGTAIAANDQLTIEFFDATSADPAHGAANIGQMSGRWMGTEFSDPVDESEIPGAVSLTELKNMIASMQRTT